MRQLARPALFLDRDGVVNEEIGYLHRFEDVRFVAGVSDLIRSANGRGLPVIIITNQAGIGRGFYTDTQFHSLMDAIRAALADQGARIDAVYYSPFHPEHGLGEYRRDTECRKPRPGMLLQAAAEHDLDLRSSMLVGDRCTDIEAGAAAGVPHLFRIEGTEPAGCSCAPHTTVQHLHEVTAWLRHHFPVETDMDHAVSA